MRVDVRVNSDEIRALGKQLDGLKRGQLNRIIGPSLGQMAVVVRRKAKQRNFIFTDKTGALRRSIRSRRIPATYGGRRYRTGAAAVFAGGPGARHAHLVEEGHGGPRPAQPHRFLRMALLQTTNQQFSAFIQRAKQRFAQVVRASRRG